MRRFVNLIIFILSVVSLLISMKLFVNMGIYVDEFNTSPNIVYGGYFWLSMAWLRLFALGLLSLVTGFQLFIKEKK